MPSCPRYIARGVVAAVLAATACVVVPPAGAAAQTIVSGPAGPTNDATPTFEFTGPDGASFACKLPPVRPEFSPCSSPFTVGEAEYTIPLADGDYLFEVRTDGEPASRAFTVDTDPPQTDITGGPGDTTDTTAVFFFSASEAASFLCRLDSGPWEPCSSPRRYPGLSLGRHRFEVAATDAAGNPDPIPAEHVWQVLRPGLVIPGTVKIATALVRELVQMRRTLVRMGLRKLARRRAIRFKTFDAITGGTVEVRSRARVRSRPRGRWVPALRGEREVPGAGRHPVQAKVTKKARRLARRRQTLPVELRLTFTDLAGRSLWASSKLRMKR